MVTGAPIAAANPPSFTIGWSVYVGWNPYQYMARSGILNGGNALHDSSHDLMCPC